MWFEGLGEEYKFVVVSLEKEASSGEIKCFIKSFFAVREAVHGRQDVLDSGLSHQSRHRTDSYKYRPLRSLAEAQQAPDGRAILDGDWGGQVYLTCPASIVRCSQDVLHHLLVDIDARCWQCNEGEGAGVYFERKPAGAGVLGGMGGGIVTDGLWLHKDVEGFGVRTQIEEILAGHRERLERSGEPGAAADGVGM
jgi:hypothetical protein